MQKTLEIISLFLLLSVVAIRPLVSESFDSAANPITQAIGEIGDPSPLRTLIFDSLILLGLLGWLIGRAVGVARRYRKTGLEWGAGLLGIAAFASCLFAGQQRLAINGSIDWLCYPILAIALVQLTKMTWQRHLLVSIVLATACVQLFQCTEQYWAGFDHTIAHYESTKEAFWSRQGVELDSKKVEAFERRMRAREATGFLPHSNVTGSYFLLCAFAAFGVAASRWKLAADTAARIQAAVITTLALAFACGIWMTGSRGAMISGGAGLVILCLARWGREKLESHPGRSFHLAWIAVAVGVIAVTGHGLYHGELPGASLTFRWQYWTASSEMIADHPLAGVGRENFGRHYLRYKPVESPEEVANPHNFVVQAAAEWGVLGGAAMILMLWGTSSRLWLRRERNCTSNRSPRSPAGPLWFWMLPLLLVVALVRLPLLGTGNSSFLYYSAMTTGIFWVTGFILLGFGVKADDYADTGSGFTARFPLAVGLLGFLLHDTINFALFTPGTATTFFALLACCLADTEPGTEECDSGTRPGGLAPVSAGLIALGAVMYFGIVPVARSADQLAGGRRSTVGALSSPLDRTQPARAFQRAISLDPFDPTPCVEYARWLGGLSSLPQVREEALTLACDALRLAISRDPRSLKLRRLLMRLLADRARSAPDKVELFSQAIEVGRASLELYPQDPEGLIAVADVAHRAGEVTGRRDWLLSALGYYELALELDSRRGDAEELHRLREKDVRDVETKIGRIRRLLEAD